MRMISMQSLLVISLLCASVMAADEITVVRDAPATAHLGEQIRITITLSNHLDMPMDASVEEQLSLPGDVVEPKPVSDSFDPNIKAARPARLEWNVRLEPKENKSVYYILKPSQVGDYPLLPTSVVAYGKSYFSDSNIIMVACNANSICEPELGENARTCPQDCPSGGSDNVCNHARDGVCDPDCAAGVDLDCLDTGTGRNGTSGGFSIDLNCIGVVIGIGLIAIAAYLCLRKKKEPPTSPVQMAHVEEKPVSEEAQTQEPPEPKKRTVKKLKRKR